jgi:hypothetical protein
VFEKPFHEHVLMIYEVFGIAEGIAMLISANGHKQQHTKSGARY